jgi:uncharacterized protein (TIGR02266 family)
VAEDPKKPAGDPAQKRKSPRVDFFQKVRVVVPEDQTAVDLFAANVSEGGMFLRSNQPLPRGKKVELEFEVPEGKVRVEDCEVVWSRPFEPISVGGEPAGMGIQFKAMAPEAQKTIEAFIEDALGDEDGSVEERAGLSMPLPLKSPPPPPAEDAPPREVIEPAGVFLTPSPRPARPPPVRLAPPTEPVEQVLTLDMIDLSEVPTEPPAPPRPTSPSAEVRQAAMAELSSPPAPRTRALLFVLFVAVVAVATFLTLWWLRPFEEKEGTAETAGTAKTEGARSPDAPKPEPPKPEPPKPEPPKPEPPKPEPPKPEPPEPEAPAAAEGQALVDLPVFERSPSGWRMEISATGPVEWKTFTLKNPARLAVDAQGADYTGKRQALENPAPFVSRVRIGKQPAFIRYVLDFGAEIPAHDIQKSPRKLVITFPSG